MRKVVLASSMLIGVPPPKEGRWLLAGYVRNIEGTRIPVNAPTYPAASSLNDITSAPRTFGVRAGVKF